MFVAIWRFTTANADEFERHYGTYGTWSQLFRRDPAYIRTDLLRDEDSYITLDWWASREAYDAFREQHAGDYAALDRVCEELTLDEEKLGEFATVE